MASSTPTEFPVILEKKVDGETVKRTAHSLIAYRQLETQGFRPKSARAQAPKAQAPKAQAPKAEAPKAQAPKAEASKPAEPQKTSEAEKPAEKPVQGEK